MTDFVRLERRNNVALVTIDRPKVNALNSQLLAELAEVFERLQEGVVDSEEVRAVVVTGAGRHFVAGADIAEMAELSPLEARKFSRAGQAAFQLIEDHRLPVIAAVNGTALGGGCELMSACDLRVAAAEALIGQPEVTLGIPPGFGGTLRLTRLVGAGKARELVLLGKPIRAEEAEEIGLVNRVVSPEKVVEEALKWGRQLAANGPVAVHLAKEALNRSADVDLTSGLAYERELFGQAFSTDDQREGMAAFLERREAEFKGK